jgi:hypothetical protein
MHKLLMLAGGLSLCLILAACKTSRRTAKISFSCEEIEEFVENNWEYRNKDDIYNASSEFIEAVNTQKMETCLLLKQDTSFLFSLLGPPQERFGLEFSYYLRKGCHPSSRELVCERLSITYDPKTSLIGKIRWVRGTNSH